MPTPENVIIKEIEQFKIDNGGDYEDYYIGITNKLSRRINESEEINEHKKTGKYDDIGPVYSADTESNEIAVRIEVYFQTQKGMKGYNRLAKGVESTKTVYCFRLADSKSVDDLINETLKKP